MHRFSDAMLISLRKKAMWGYKELQDYLDKAMDNLNGRPQTVADMSNAKSGWKELASKKREMQRLMAKV